MKINENPVNCEQARFILGGTRPCSRCAAPGSNLCSECKGLAQVPKPWSRSYMSAVKKAMGIKSRNFYVSDVRKFIRDNTDFTSKPAAGGADTFKSLLVAALDTLRTNNFNAMDRSLVTRIERKLAA